MADDKYFMGIDVGTTSLKVVLIDGDANTIALKSASYSVLSEMDDYAQLSAETIREALIACVKELEKTNAFILQALCGIGISSLCPGLVAMDADGNVLLDPILYSDRRSREEAELIREHTGDERLFRLTANGSMAGAFSGSTMLWIKRHAPDVYRKTHIFGHINTWLAHSLTGIFAMDYSNASYSNLFETTGARTWNSFLCDAIGIEQEKLPALFESVSVIGTLCAEELIACGVKRDTPVVIGGGDTACASFAAGVTREGDVCESVGTTDVLTICVEKPVFDRRFINRCHVVPDAWIYQGAMSFTGAANEWFLEQFCKDILRNSKDRSSAFESMNREAGEALPGCGGVVFLPYLQGERSPVWDADARGVFFGLNLHTTRNDLNRAVLESCGYGLRQMIEIVEDVSGLTFDTFRSMGGGAKSLTWAQIKADITGKNIDILDMNDMAPVGAALLAGVGTGHYHDVYDAAAHVKRDIWHSIKATHDHDEVYEMRYKIYNTLYPSLKDVFRMNVKEEAKHV